MFQTCTKTIHFFLLSIQEHVQCLVYVFCIQVQLVWPFDGHEHMNRHHDNLFPLGSWWEISG